MNHLIKCCRTICAKNLKRTLNKPLSTQVQEMKTDDKDLFKRVFKKHPQRPPFMKNNFLGQVDTEMLGFPEVLDNEALKQLNEKISHIENYFSKLASSQIDKKTKIPADILMQLKTFKLFAMQGPELLNGLELNDTENCRFLEIIAQCRSIATSIVTHQNLGAHVIADHNDEMIRNAYLPLLLKGEHISAFCLLEENYFDSNSINTTAKLSEDGKTWILNGKKCWVINGSQGKLYTVLATIEDIFEPNQEKEHILFLVEKAFGGITTEPCKPIGLTGTDMCNVNFDNTVIPIENVLAQGKQSLELISSHLAKLRMNSGSMSISLLKDLSKNFFDFCKNKKQGQQYLLEQEYIKNIMAQINLNLYAIESVTYMTAGLLDKYEKQDCELESAIVKVFSSERCLESVDLCLNIIGISTYMNDHWLQTLRNDAYGQVFVNETNESLRIIISILGLQHAGVGLNDNVKKSRNPFFFPLYAIKKSFEHRRQAEDNPKMTLRLEDFLHPSLIRGAKELEYCIYRLQYATEILLIRNGPQVIERHMDMRRLANVAIDVYAMVAVLSRASRSYCIGLRNADCEMLMATAFCMDAVQRVKNNVSDIYMGRFNSNDKNYIEIAKRAYKFNGYFAEHPLTKNF